MVVVLLAVDLIMWAVGFAMLKKATNKTTALEDLLEKVSSGMTHKELKVSVLSNLGDEIRDCSAPTNKWLILPVLGPVIKATQHQLYAKCLKVKIATSSFHQRSMRNFVYYWMLLAVTFSSITFPFTLTFEIGVIALSHILCN